MSLECPHCEENVDELSRTGDKRYACNHCNRVIKHDTVKSHLDEIPVKDKRKKNKEDKDDDSEEQEEVDLSEAAGSNAGSGDGSGSTLTKTNRDIIREEGHVGLKRIKKDKLREWLATTDGVGGKTENRILMVFESDEMYSSEPTALYNLLDDELNASPSYINTVVNSVFGPEYEHSDLLKRQGYTPFFEPGGGRPGPGGNGMNNGFNNNYNQTPNQGGQQQQFQPQQQQQQQQDSGGMSYEEALQMIKASKEEDNSGSRRRGPATEAVDQATEEAIRNMAQNMGGFFGTMQQVAEEALLAYFRKHPEKLVENMTLLQAFMSAGDQEEEEKEEPIENQKIDNALEQAAQNAGIADGGTSPQTGSMPTQQQPMATQPGPSGGNPSLQNDEQGFQPDLDIMEGGGPDPGTQSDELGGHPVSENDGEQVDDWDFDSDNDDNSDEESEETDEFDELFGDLQ